MFKGQSQTFLTDSFICQELNIQKKEVLTEKESDKVFFMYVP